MLDHAVALASRIGLGGLSIGDLARATGLSKSGLFAHFDSKLNLQLEVLRTSADRFVASVLAQGPEEAHRCPAHPRPVRELALVVQRRFKFYGHDDRLEERVVSIVERAGMESQIVVMSLKQDLIENVRALRPDWTIGLLTATAVGDLAKVDADFLAVHAGLATRRFLRDAHAAGKDVYVWTVNDPVHMSRLITRGVDGLITDDPALARRVIAERAKLSSLQRLLLEAAFWLGAIPQEPPPERDAG